MYDGDVGGEPGGPPVIFEILFFMFIAALLLAVSYWASR
jgi:hypothetical protein